VGTRTSSFGVSKREGHDSSIFYSRNLYKDLDIIKSDFSIENKKNTEKVLWKPMEEWADKIYCGNSENMNHIPDNSIALAFTSPPYNTGKEYDKDLDLSEYLRMIGRVATEIYRVLKPGGRYVINIANLGRKPYIPLHAYYYFIHIQSGFFPMGEIIWQKFDKANGSCAWGSWLSAKAPRLRDIHEYLLVFGKNSDSRPEKGKSDITTEEFMSSTLSVWKIPPESAKRVGHPAPFSIPLAERVVKLYSYLDDIILDPFCGSGTTCVAAKRLNRHYIGYDVNDEYCMLSERRLLEEANGKR
jgi:modification methylase